MKRTRNIYSKAQISGQILIYVLAIIIFGLTLLYGYKAVKYFTQQGNDISEMQFETNMKSEIEKIKSDSVGTVKKKILEIPGNYKHVCFIESYPDFPAGPIATGYDLVDEHVGSTHDKNMFLAPPGDLSFNIGDIKVDDAGNKFECITVLGNKVTLRLESMGDHVWVSSWD